MSNLVLVCTVYVDDGWYGDRHRYLLSESPGTGFATKTIAKKYTVRLRKYAQQQWLNMPVSRERTVSPITNENIVCGESDSFVPYTHVSFGPSLIYTHHNISLEDLL